MENLYALRKCIEYYVVRIIVVGVSLALIVLLIVPFTVYVWLVVRRIVWAVQTEPLYWLSWVDVKRKTQCSRVNVLHVLCQFARPNSLFDCQLRPEHELVRLERVLKRERPQHTHPTVSDDAVFYRFRRRGGGTLSWKLPVGTLSVPSIVPARA